MQKKVRGIMTFLLVFVMGITSLMSDMSSVHAADEKVAESDTADTINLDSEDPLGLGKEIMSYVGHKRKDILDYPSKSRTVNGQVVNITPGRQINYGGWSTNEFSIDSKYLGYCAEPNSPTPAGNFPAYELNNDMVKACLMCAPGGPLDGKIPGFPSGSIFYDTNVPGGNVYANAHAAIGYVYSGSLVGLSPSYAAGIKNFVQLASNIKNNGTGNYDPAAAWGAWKVMIAPNNNQDIVWLEGTPKNGKVKIVKKSANSEITDDNSCYSLKGAQYGVYTNSNCSAQAWVATLTTEADGNSNVVELKAGTYYIKEAVVPKGYALDKTVYTVTIKSGETYTLNVKDIPQNDPVLMVLGKIDKETNENKPQGSASLKNAEFTVKYYKGFYDKIPDIKPERTWVLRTNEEGKTAFVDSLKVSGDEFYKTSLGNTLPLGTITIQETKAPEGYLINDEVFIRQIISEGNAEGVDTYNMPSIPEQSLNLDIVKILKGTGIVIPGVEFQHTLPDGTTEIVITDENGQASIKGLTWGTHVIEEISVPEGYTKNPGKITFTVEEDNTIKVTQNTAVDKTGKMTFTVKADGCAEMVVEDVYAPYQLHLTKENETGKNLQGAEFTLYSDKECTKEIAKGITKEEGTLDFSNLQVETKYYLKETKAPEGYQIPVNEDGSAIVYEFYTKSNPLEGVFEYYVNGIKYTEKDGIYAVIGTKMNRIVNLTVVNRTGLKMPETGTPWSLVIILTGAACMIGAFVYSLRKDKKEKKQYEENEKK